MSQGNAIHAAGKPTSRPSLTTHKHVHPQFLPISLQSPSLLNFAALLKHFVSWLASCYLPSVNHIMSTTSLRPIGSPQLNINWSHYKEDPLISIYYHVEGHFPPSYARFQKTKDYHQKVKLTGSPLSAASVKPGKYSQCAGSSCLPFRPD